MGIIQRQSIKSTIYTYIGTLVGFIYTALIWPNFLSKSEIGALNLLVSYAIIFAQLSSLGINHVIIRFFPFFKEDKKKKGGFLLFILLVAGVGFLLVLFVYYIIKPGLLERNQSQSPLFAQFFFLVVPITFFTLFYNLFDAYARGLYYSTTGSLLKELLQRVLILLVTVLFIFEFFGQDGLFASYAIAICFPALLMGFFLVLKKEFKITGSFSFLQGDLLKNMGLVAFFGILTGFGTLAIAQIDKIMINGFLSEEETGVYATTFLFGTLIIMPARAIQRIAPSLIAQSFKDNDLDTINKIYYKSCLNQFIVALWIFLGIWLNVDNIFQILPQDYISGKYVIFFIGLANVINMAGGMNNGILANSKYFAYNAWFVGLLLVFIVVTNWIFIPIWGIVGAAAASTLSMFIYNTIKATFLFKKFGFQPYNSKFLILIAVTTITFLIVDWIPFIPNLILSIFIISLLTTILFIGTVFYLRISEDLNDLIWLYIRKLLKKY